MLLIILLVVQKWDKLLMLKNNSTIKKIVMFWIFLTVLEILWKEEKNKAPGIHT